MFNSVLGWEGVGFKGDLSVVTLGSGWATLGPGTKQLELISKLYPHK